MTLLHDHETNTFKGVAFVTMRLAGEAEQACQSLNNVAYQGRKLRVNMATSRRQ